MGHGPDGVQHGQRPGPQPAASAPAERADVIVDFSKYAGKTLILYNDAPTAFPALDPRTDYFTNDEDHTDTGGTTSTKAGFGPNTRTIMQIKVAGTTPAPAFDLTALNAAFTSTASTDGVFKASQNPIHIPDARYNSAYNTSFTADPYVRIFETVSHTFKTARQHYGHDAAAAQGDPRRDGRDVRPGVRAHERQAGPRAARAPTLRTRTSSCYSFSDPDDRDPSGLDDPAVAGQARTARRSGRSPTTAWTRTRSTSTCFDVQLINRVGWDGFIRVPDDNELGWKDTVRISPLEDTIVALQAGRAQAALRPARQRPPAQPGHARSARPMGFTNIDPQTGQALTPPITNQMIELRLGVRVALPHPEPRRDGHDASGGAR